MRDNCPLCGDEYSSLGAHFNANPGHRPNIDEELVKGLLMGDGCLTKRSKKNSCLTINMTNKDYLEYLDREFGCLSTGVKLKNSSKEQAEIARSGGLNPNTKSKNYKDIYRLSTRRHPKLNQFRGWYKDNGKEFPKGLSLSPKTLKTWYCCDGYWDNKSFGNRIIITASNERGNESKINNMFTSVGLPKPSAYQQNRRDRGGWRFNIQFNKGDSKYLWEYMGCPPDGFKYKWPERYYENRGD